MTGLPLTSGTRRCRMASVLKVVYDSKYQYITCFLVIPLNMKNFLFQISMDKKNLSKVESGSYQSELR